MEDAVQFALTINGSVQFSGKACAERYNTGGQCLCSVLGIVVSGLWMLHWTRLPAMVMLVVKDMGRWKIDMQLFFCEQDHSF